MERADVITRFVFDEWICWFISRTQEFQVLDPNCLTWDGTMIVLLVVMCLYEIEDLQLQHDSWLGFFHSLEFGGSLNLLGWINKMGMQFCFQKRDVRHFLFWKTLQKSVLFRFGLTKSPSLWFGCWKKMLHLDLQIFTWVLFGFRSKTYLRIWKKYCFHSCTKKADWADNNFHAFETSSMTHHSLKIHTQLLLSPSSMTY